MKRNLTEEELDLAISNIESIVFEYGDETDDAAWEYIKIKIEHGETIEEEKLISFKKFVMTSGIIDLFKTTEIGKEEIAGYLKVIEMSLNFIKNN